MHPARSKIPASTTSSKHSFQALVQCLSTGRQQCQSAVDYVTRLALDHDGVCAVPKFAGAAEAVNLIAAVSMIRSPVMGSIALNAAWARPIAGGSLFAHWCRFICGTSPERIAPESLTPFLSEFVHGHILYCRRCPPQYPVKRTNCGASRGSRLTVRQPSDLRTAPQAGPVPFIASWPSLCSVVPQKGIGSPASHRAQLASGL
jgi:hypothetical protein